MTRNRWRGILRSGKKTHMRNVILKFTWRMSQVYNCNNVQLYLFIPVSKLSERINVLSWQRAMNFLILYHVQENHEVKFVKWSPLRRRYHLLIAGNSCTKRLCKRRKYFNRRQKQSTGVIRKNTVNEFTYN